MMGVSALFSLTPFTHALQDFIRTTCLCEHNPLTFVTRTLSCERVRGTLCGSLETPYSLQVVYPFLFTLLAMFLCNFIKTIQLHFILLLQESKLNEQMGNQILFNTYFKLNSQTSPTDRDALFPSCWK